MAYIIYVFPSYASVYFLCMDFSFLKFYHHENWNVNYISNSKFHNAIDSRPWFNTQTVSQATKQTLYTITAIKH